MIFALKGNELYISNDRNAVKWMMDKDNSSLSDGEYLPAAKRALPPVRTPSGEEHYVCDDTIRPIKKK